MERGARIVERMVTVVEADPKRIFGQLVKRYRERSGLLEEMGATPGVIIQVVRFGATGHPGSEGSSRIMEFPDKSPIWCTEGWNVGRTTDVKEEVSTAANYFNLIRASALPPDQSARFIATVRGSRYE